MTDAARIYGTALFELAREENLDGEIFEELKTVKGIFDENPDYVRLLSTPSLTKEERRGALDGAFAGRVHEYVASFLKLLVDREAVRELSGCLQAYKELHYDHSGIMEVTVTTAVELSVGARKALLAKLDAVFGKKIILETRVDPSVLGGMRLECAGKRYDGTVRDRLSRIERGLREMVL